MLSQVAKELQSPLFTPVSQVRPADISQMWPRSNAAGPADSLGNLPSINTGDRCLGWCLVVTHHTPAGPAAHPAHAAAPALCLQAVSRRVAHHTFGHVLGLDIRYHLDRRTGELSRVLERGTRSTQTLFRGIVFTLMPTFLELILVCGTLGSLFNGAVAAAVAATFAVYVAFTAHYIRLSAQVRKDLNDLDTRTSGKAVDALLNYETVRSLQALASPASPSPVFAAACVLSTVHSHACVPLWEVVRRRRGADLGACTQAWVRGCVAVHDHTWMARVACTRGLGSGDAAGTARGRVDGVR